VLLSAALPTNNRLGLERFARDKHSLFLREFVHYGQRSFITLAPELPVDVHGEQGGGGIEDGSLKKIQNFGAKFVFNSWI
jgi:hypothetical protein